MDNHKLMLKISRLLPSSFSSCHLRSLPDVAESSIKIAKQNDISSLSLSPHHQLPPNKTLLPPKTHKRPPAAHSSASNGGWFSSSDDLETTETFFSLSSNSGDSFRLRTAAHTFKQMKSIDEVGRRSFSSAVSFDAAPTKCTRRTPAPTAAGGKKPSKTAAPHHELGSDLVLTQLYYGGAGCRRRRGARDRRRTKKSSGGAAAGESFAVEKSSSDPRGDFRASMVEMIVEKQIFAAADLERLLRCFLSLNAAAYHGIIIDVFSEICQTLFAN